MVINITFVSFFCGTLLSNVPNFQISPGIVVGPVNPPYIMPITNYDVSGYENNDNVRSFSNGFDLKLGDISSVENADFIEYDDFIVYKSNWAPWQNPIYESFPIYQYNTYTFDSYIDTPIYDLLLPESVEPGNSITFEINLNTSYTVFKAEASSISTELYWQISQAYGTTLGGRATLFDFFNFGTEYENSITWKVGGSIATTIEQNQETSLNLELNYNREFNYENNSNVTKKFRPCVRQKFKVYFIVCFEYNYTCTKFNSGSLGYDENWEYDFLKFTGVKTTFFTLPVDSPYFEISTYVYSEDGLDVNEKGFMNNIWFL